MMKLIGPWMSGYTRRVGITLKLLGMPFEHLDWSGYAQRDAIRQYSPMGKVPALALDDGDVLVDSSAIVDYLYELAGPTQTLLPAAGQTRRDALFCAAVALEAYGKHSQIYMEMSRPAAGRHQGLIEALLRQVLTGFQMLEARAVLPWMLGEQLSHADIMTVVTFQAAAAHPIFGDVNAINFPKLAAIAERARQLPAFIETAD